MASITSGRGSTRLQSHHVVKLIKILPLTSRRSEVTCRLRQLITRRRPFAPFTYRGVVEFQVLADDALDTLGGDSIAQQDVASQLIYDSLVEPAEHRNLINNLEDRIVEEQHKMRVYTHGQRKVEHRKQVVVLWARWVYARGTSTDYIEFFFGTSASSWCRCCHHFKGLQLSGRHIVRQRG